MRQRRKKIINFTYTSSSYGFSFKRRTNYKTYVNTRVILSEGIYKVSVNWGEGMTMQQFAELIENRE